MGNKLYCGNLAYETTANTLSDLFGEVGEVVSVNLITDRYTGRSRGFAFVEMMEAEVAQQAINQLNGRDVDGRELKVAEARPQNERRDDRPRGGRGKGRY